MRLISILFLTAALAAAADDANNLFQKALVLERTQGNLPEAIKLYQRIVDKHGGNRKVAAQALLQLAGCHERLGSSESRKAYERLVRDFADQKDSVAEARKHLAGMGKSPDGGVVARRIEAPADEARVHEVSRDGRFLVCKGNAGEIYLREVETGEVRTILGPSPIMRHPLRLSPDGSRIAFVSRPGGAPAELHVVRIDGSGLKAFTAKELGGIPRLPTLWDWSPDGQNLLLSVTSEDRKGKVILLRVSDSTVRDLGSAAGFSPAIHQARFSPDGRFIAYTKSGGPGYMGKGIALRTLDGSRDVGLSPDGINPLWTPDGKRVLFTSNRRGPTDLWTIPVANGEPAGPAEMVREAVSWLVGVTRDGELFHKTMYEVRDLYTVEFDPQSGHPTSKATKITHRYANAGSAWSPDGKLLAYTSIRDGMEPGAGEPASLVVRTMATGEERVVAPRILLDMNLSNPQWFPDSRSLLIQPQWGQQNGKLAKVDIDTGAVDFLLESKPGFGAGNWYDPGVTLAPGGEALYYASGGPESGKARIIRRDLPSGQEKELRAIESKRGTHVSVSPDGARLAFWIDRTLMTMPASGGEPAPVNIGAVIPSGAFSAWSADGKRIFFVGATKLGDSWRNQEADIWSVPAEGGESVPLGIGLHTIYFFHIHPDGKRIVFYDEFYPKGELWSLKNLQGIAKVSR